MIAGTNPRRPPDHHMRLDNAAGAYLYIRTYVSPGTNLNVVGQFRGGINNGLVMNHDV
jgi:hypothetical protein